MYKAPILIIQGGLAKILKVKYTKPGHAKDITKSHFYKDILVGQRTGDNQCRHHKHYATNFVDRNPNQHGSNPGLAAVHEWKHGWIHPSGSSYAHRPVSAHNINEGGITISHPEQPRAPSGLTDAMPDMLTLIPQISVSMLNVNTTKWTLVAWIGSA